MRIRKVEFVWEKSQVGIIRYADINNLRIVFSEAEVNPVVYIDAGIIKIEDRSFAIDSNYVLKRIGELDCEKVNNPNLPKEFSQNHWKLIVNDSVYEGFFQIPHYVSKIKKIIRYEIIWEEVNKKIARYVK